MVQKKKGGHHHKIGTTTTIIIIIIHVVIFSCFCPFSYSIVPTFRVDGGDLLFDYFFFAAGTKYCIFHNSGQANCIFTTEKWKHLKETDLDLGKLGGNRFRMNALNNRQMVEQCIDKLFKEGEEDKRMFGKLYRNNLFNACIKHAGISMQKLVENVQNLIEEMEKLFRQKISYNFNAERIWQMDESKTKSHLMAFVRNHEKKLQIVWMFTNVHQLLEEGKVPNIKSDKQLGAYQPKRRELEVRWLQEHIRIMLEKWFPEKVQYHSGRIFFDENQKEIADEEYGIIEDFLEMYRKFFTERVYKEMVAKKWYEWDNFDGGHEIGGETWEEEENDGEEEEEDKFEEKGNGGKGGENTLVRLIKNWSRQISSRFRFA